MVFIDSFAFIANICKVERFKKAGFFTKISSWTRLSFEKWM